MGMMTIDSKLASMRFFQQNLQHSVPYVHIGILIVVLSIICTFSLSIGAFLLVEADSIQSNQIVHNNSATLETQKIDIQNIDKTKPLFIYYQINDFHQNVRSYILGYDWYQVTSNDSFASLKLTANCQKAQSAADVVDYPCGIQFRTMNRDKYTLSQLNGTDISIKRDNITLPGDRVQTTYFGLNFKSYDFAAYFNIQGLTWEDVANWMRPSTFTQATKLYGIITPDVLQTFTDNEINVNSIGIHEDSREVFSKQRTIIFSQIGSIAGKQETERLSYFCLFLGYFTAMIIFILAITLALCGPRGKKYQELQGKFLIKL